MESPAAAAKMGNRTMMVKMDERHGYIQWLLEREKEPPRTSPHLARIPDPEIRARAIAAFAMDDEMHDTVLAQYKRCGYAHVQIDLLNDDEIAGIDLDKAVQVDPVDDDEAERIFGRL